MKRKSVILTLLLCAAMLVPTVQASAGKISGTSAAAKKAKALVKGATVTEVDTDREGGVTVYEVTLVKGKKEYEVKYRASDGVQLSYEWDLINYVPSGRKHISRAKVKKLALKQVPGAKITKLSLDVSDGEYDVDMTKGKKKYTLEYDAYNGKLISYQWKLVTAKSSSNDSFIGVEKAKSIAKKKAPAGAVFKKVKLDKDDGRYVYEVEMKKGNMEYEMTIDAKTGKILEYESERDD